MIKEKFGKNKETHTHITNRFLTTFNLVLKTNYFHCKNKHYQKLMVVQWTHEFQAQLHNLSWSTRNRSTNQQCR